MKRSAGIQPAELACERHGLVRGPDDAVGSAPPELERHSRVRECSGVLDWAAACIRARGAARRAADFLPRELAQPGAERVSPLPETAPVARKAGEIAVAAGHVGYGVERGDAGEELRMGGSGQQRLLAAHARAEPPDALRFH